MPGDRTVGLHEGSGQVGLTGQGDADAGVVDLEPQPVGLVSTGCTRNVTLAPAREFEPVADQVDQHLAQPVGVAAQHERRRDQRLDLELQPALDRLRCQQRAHLLEHRREREIRPAPDRAGPPRAWRCPGCR